jgi:hypothetical protein
LSAGHPNAKATTIVEKQHLLMLGLLPVPLELILKGFSQPQRFLQDFDDQGHPREKGCLILSPPPKPADGATGSTPGMPTPVQRTDKTGSRYSFFWKLRLKFGRFGSIPIKTGCFHKSIFYYIIGALDGIGHYLIVGT